jgi:two-component sensor histidine kinase
MASPAGFALKTGKPVISNHLANEGRFRTPELLVEYGIRRAMNVILEGDGTPYGVLEVDSRSQSEFNEDDLVFLQGMANILGMAIERERSENHIKEALGRQEILLKEINHRVNNSLQIVSGMLHLQSSITKNEDVRYELGAASNRIGAIARAHQRLYSSNEIHKLDLSAYLREVCRDLESAIPGCQIAVTAVDGIEIATDRAIPAALLVNELVTNIAKYACKPGECRAWLTLSRGPADTITISVRDEGTGLPPDFDLKSKRRLGMQLINAFVTQLKGDLTIRRLEPGTEFTLTVPLAP